MYVCLGFLCICFRLIPSLASTSSSSTVPGRHHEAAAARQDSGQAGDAVHAESGGDDGQAHAGQGVVALGHSSGIYLRPYKENSSGFVLGLYS